jgi:hypothetical protein
MACTNTVQSTSNDTYLPPLLDDEKKTNEEAPPTASFRTSDDKLHTAQISLAQNDTLQALSKIIESIQCEASKRLQVAVALQNKVSIPKLCNCSLLLHYLSRDLIDIKDSKVQSIYIAYRPKDMTIQGIATCVFSYSEAPCKLMTLLTHPKNIPLTENEKRVQRVGVALIKHILKDIYEKNAIVNKELFLVPYDSAKEFYERLGFISAEQSSPQGYFWKDDLFLTIEKGIALIKKYEDVSETDKNPPSISKLS